MDAVEVRQTDEGTTVVLTRRLARAAG
jgi:hypothetical protein